MSCDVALVFGQWGQNIGNAFFNVGGRHAITMTLGHSPTLVQDAPAYWTLHRKSRGNFKKWFNTIEALAPRYLVLQGPFLNQHLATIWSDTVTALNRRVGTQLIGISAGFFTYSATERKSVAAALHRLPFGGIITRDVDTLGILNEANLDFPVCLGIDSSAFFPLAYQITDTVATNRIVLTFDRYPEPYVQKFDPHRPLGTRLSARVHRSRLAEHGHTSAALARLTRIRHPRHGPEIEKRIIRGFHRTNPHIPSLVYRYENTFASDEPYTYAEVYGSADSVVSDRVHAIALSLAYGTPAAYLTSSPRGGLLERLGNSASSQAAIGFREYEPEPTRAADYRTTMLKDLRSIIV